LDTFAFDYKNTVAVIAWIEKNDNVGIFAHVIYATLL
jgi:hypothetical protein